MTRIHITDSESGEVVLDKPYKGQPVKSEAVRHNEHGMLYGAVEAWVADVQVADRVESHVFVSWVDGTNTRPGAKKPQNRHTLEASVPGGGMGHFLVVVS